MGPVDYLRSPALIRREGRLDREEVRGRLVVDRCVDKPVVVGHGEALADRSAVVD